MTEIRVPELGESIVEATVLNWLKQVGDAVAEGEAIAELETDKVNVEVIADHAGVIQSILKQAGETVAVGDVLCVLAHANAAETAAPAPSPAAEAPTAVRATPAARRRALEQGVDLARVQAGADGRITEADVRLAGRQAPPDRQAHPAASPSLRPDEERVPMSRRRLTIARRLVEVQHKAAMLTTFNEVDMSAILDIRRRRRDSFLQQHGVRLGLMSFFTKAVVGALKAIPQLNAEIQGDDMILKYHYDIGIAVATDAGLVVPVVRNADRLSFAEIERQIEELARKARNNTLTPQELEGGTFTITNGGVFGSLMSTPILNGPQVGILGMHKIQERPVAVNGEVVIRPMMYLALSYDHRIVDGSEAVRFLVKVKELLEDPESLLLEG
ncbi:MAG: 2-oxoglutarate dehydrogenase complex dihydrolipoyllysine-residue succinyltransferase [Alicyclobacillaceae bacterium]|nr:2-oxoglutarate dehydrogenase complex dihydrolipoyllysine-residue succinyltransferase [Alicyclobacillaceae bacterium]